MSPTLRTAGEHTALHGHLSGLVNLGLRYSSAVQELLDDLLGIVHAGLELYPVLPQKLCRVALQLL
jgi:formylmethanofuran dehydrogenase subunit E